ncbi:MAG: oxidoreductase [Verrucomicrobiales bacterium]|nr:oxidoreductase [Verrucomicrobiales bacterium]
MKTNRRKFLQTTAATTAAFSIIPHARSDSPGRKLNIGVIGTQGRARGNIAGVKGENIVAVCDVDRNNLAKAKEQFPGAKGYEDFRKMLEQKDIEAVVVSTPDHTHAVCTVYSLQSGRHVYCEKPLTHTLSEARIVTDVAQRSGLKTQMGNQIHSHPQANYRRVVELIQSGAIGKVSDVHVWSGARYGAMDLKPNPGNPPDSLNYDLWLGPQKYRPWRPEYAPFKWRNFWAFGGGTLADFWCHFADLPFWALGLKYPISVEAEGANAHPIFTTLDMKVTYQFPADESGNAVKLTWYQGKYRPRNVLTADQLKRFGSGVLFVGEKGQLLANYTKRELFPEADFKDFTPSDPFIKDSTDHHGNWLNAIKNGGWSETDFSYAGPLTETGLLGNVANRCGMKIYWDPTSLKAINAPEADEFIQHDYREGWKI